MEIKPTNEVRLYKNVPFYIDYKNVVLFDNTAKQEEYFNSLPTLEFNNVTYTRSSGQIKVKAQRDSLLDYNYMSFTNKNYTNKTFYAFITSVTYVNPNTTLVSFVIDEWQTWCFDLSFRDSFIERKHCKRWNSDGTPVINTQDEGLDFGNQYIVKDHKEYNNNLYWVCFVSSCTSVELSYNGESNISYPEDVPTALSIFYAPIYKTTSSVITEWDYNGLDMYRIRQTIDLFRNDSVFVNKLKSFFIVSEPPFPYTYEIVTNNVNGVTTKQISISTTGDDDNNIFGTDANGNKVNLGICKFSRKNPQNIVRTFPKYGNLKNNITESKLLMYPYSFVQLIDGQGANFDIKLEYLNDTSINVRTFTNNGLNSKQAHIIDKYSYQGVTLNYCRWELGNGIINCFPNNLTIVDDYSAAYIQGNANQISSNIENVINQGQASKQMAYNTAKTDLVNSGIRAGINVVGTGVQAGTTRGTTGKEITGSVTSATLYGLGEIGQTFLTGKNMYDNTELQGNVNNENAMRSALAKKQDAKNVADNVALQGGDVYFTFQNQYNGYCLVYKQISDEYIRVLEDFFKKFGYAYNKIETPNLHTRKSWDYIRTVDCNIKANINNESLEKIKTIFNNGVTIWHTTDVDNYSLNNDEI